MSKIKLYTIGFTKKNAEEFFSLLKTAKINKIIDIRLNNVSQLAGFAKKDDLKFFLRELAGADYIYKPLFAPTKDILDEYKKNKGNWSVYEREFKTLIEQRKIEKLTSLDELNNACLLCSEATPEQCHRRLVAEYLKSKYPNIEIIHLVKK